MTPPSMSWTGATRPKAGRLAALLHRSGNPVAREHVAVDLDAEARALRHDELSVDQA